LATLTTNNVISYSTTASSGGNIIDNGGSTLSARGVVWNTTGAWSYYDHDEGNNLVYGKLYNWYSTKGDTLCPVGWHVPNDEDWTNLTSYLEGQNVAGVKMKSTGTAFWNDPNTGATNESGFSALPGGYRYNAGVFFSIGYGAFFWSATASGIYDFNASNCFLYVNGVTVNSGFQESKSNGASVRCLKD